MLFHSVWPLGDKLQAMKTIQRLLFKETAIAVAFVTLCFLSLFFFFDLIEELPRVGSANSTYQLRHALAYVLLNSTNHLYELLPMTVLIGTIFVMSRLAQNSEFTILRTSGLGPFLALKTMLKLGLAFIVIAFVVGDYVAPICDRYASAIKFKHGVGSRWSASKSNAWLKDARDDQALFIKVSEHSTDGASKEISIFQYAPNGEWVSTIHAKSAHLDRDQWTLKDIQKFEIPNSDNATHISKITLTELTFKTQIKNEMILASLLNPHQMKTIDLFTYVRHLKNNGQSSQKFEIEFWKKIFYPLSCIVMIVLALPFAYMHFRSGNIAANVFGGVLIGISFFMLNNISNHIGTIYDWTPWISAAIPSILYILISLGAFSWLVIRH
jgi:lipopolysaccharide export system permease protein